MNIIAIFDVDSKRMTSVEDKSILHEGQTEFVSSYSTNPDMFIVHDIVCTQTVFNTVVEKAGTRQAPALIDSNTAPRVDGRTNLYVENGSLKIAS